MNTTPAAATQLTYPGFEWEAALDHFVDYSVHEALARAWAARLPGDTEARAAAELAAVERNGMLQQLIEPSCEPGTEPPTEEAVLVQAARDIITRLAAHVVQDSAPVSPQAALEA